MKKTIILDEDAFNKIKNAILKEAMQQPQRTDFIQKYVGDIGTLAKIKNLREDRYKDYKLEEAFENWKNTGFDKNSEEYKIYISEFKHFMFGNGGLLAHISYTLDRLKTKDGNPLSLDKIVLDTDWVKGALGASNWKYSDTNTNNGAADKQCFYTTILKLYQNPVVWNDFFFNPYFEEYYEKFLNIRKKLTQNFIDDIEFYKRNYAKILPVKEYAELNKFAGAIKQINNKLELVQNTQNAKPEIFYDPQFGGVNDSEDIYDEEF